MHEKVGGTRDDPLLSLSPPPIILILFPDCIHSGSMPAERSRKPEEKKGKGGISVPEAAGLPTDEAFAYLTMLKR